jgi:hypothetical protein
MPIFRWINGFQDTPEVAADWERIDRLLQVRGALPLNRPTTRILVAEDETGKLLGFLCMTLLPHIEPMWILPAERGTGLPEELGKQMQSFMEECRAPIVYLVADNPFVIRLAEKHGMELIESPVYRKVLIE